MTDTTFNETDAFWKHVREQTGGDRADIAAINSPMIYTDIEDKIEQLRERMDRIETRQDILDNSIRALFSNVQSLNGQSETLYNRSTEEWLAKKPKSSKKRKRSK